MLRQRHQGSASPVPCSKESVSCLDLEQALAIAAYVVLRHGGVYAPLFDRLEKEIEAVRRRQSHLERARRTLRSMSIEVREAEKKSGDVIM